MSIPMTCHTQDNVLVKKEEAEVNFACIPDFLLYIHEPEYDFFLRELVRTSLTSVVQVFFSEQWPQVATDLCQHTLSASKQDCLVLFYLMLNVDANLKKKIVLLDKPQNRTKIGRFLYDLKHTLVPNFYTSEQCSLAQFVLDCQDAYIIS